MRNISELLAGIAYLWAVLVCWAFSLLDSILGPGSGDLGKRPSLSFMNHTSERWAHLSKVTPDDKASRNAMHWQHSEPLGPT